MEISLRHETLDFGVAQKRSLLALAFLVLIAWTLQITTGFMSLGLLAYRLDVQYSELVGIIVDGTYVWLLRTVHMCGANLVVVLLVLHMQKSLAGFTIVNPVRLHV